MVEHFRRVGFLAFGMKITVCHLRNEVQKLILDLLKNIVNIVIIQVKCPAIIPGQVGDLANGALADIFLFIELQECFLEIFLRFRSALLVPVHRQTLSSAKVFAECFLSLKV